MKPTLNDFKHAAIFTWMEKNLPQVSPVLLEIGIKGRMRLGPAE